MVAEGKKDLKKKELRNKYKYISQNVEQRKKRQTVTEKIRNRRVNSKTLMSNERNEQMR